MKGKHLIYIAIIFCIVTLALLGLAYAYYQTQVIENDDEERNAESPACHFVRNHDIDDGSCPYG